MATIIQAKYDELSSIEKRFYDQAKTVDTLQKSVQASYDQIHRTWTGDDAQDFFRDMEQNVLPALARLTTALNQSGVTTRTISTLFQKAEEDASLLIKNGANGNSLPGAAGGGGGGGSSGASGEGGKAGKKDEPPPSFAKFPTSLQQGIRTDVYANVAAGKMTKAEADKMYEEIQKNPLDPRWKDYVEAKVSLYEHRTDVETSAHTGTITSSIGSIRGDLFGSEKIQKDSVDINKEGLSISRENSQLDYAARLREDVHVGDLSVKTDTTLFSAESKSKVQFSVGPQGVSGELSGSQDYNIYNTRIDADLGGFHAAAQSQAGVMLDGKAKLEANPLSGNLRVTAEGNAFVGDRTQGQLTYQFGPFKFGVQGEVDAGVGVGGKADIGVENGVGHLSVGAYASDGVGAGGGVIAEFDAKEAGKEISDAVSTGYHLLFGK